MVKKINKEKRSQMFSGKYLSLYNLSLYLSGLFLAHKKILTLINLKNKENFLDIGCGTGRIIFELNKKYRNKEFYGIDPDSNMINIAQSKLNKITFNKKPRNNIHFKIAFGQDLPFLQNTFDFVNSTLAFHHINKKDKIKTIQEINKVLKQNGKLLISDLGDRPKGIFSKLIYKLLVKNHAFTKDNLEIIEQELEKLGFKKDRTYTTFGYLEHIFWKRKN